MLCIDITSFLIQDLNVIKHFSDKHYFYFHEYSQVNILKYCLYKKSMSIITVLVESYFHL